MNTNNVHFDVYTLHSCEPCKRLKKQAIDLRRDVAIFWHDLTEEPDRAIEMGITKFPTIVARKGETEVSRLVSSRIHEINGFLRDNMTIYFDDDF